MRFPVLPENSCSHFEFRFHAHFTQDAKRVISTTESTEITETSSKPPPLCALCPLWWNSWLTTGEGIVIGFAKERGLLSAGTGPATGVPGVPGPWIAANVLRDETVLSLALWLGSSTSWPVAA